MSELELLAIAPQIILSAAIVMQLFMIAVKRSINMIQLFTLGSIIIAATSIYLVLPALNTQATILFYFDGFSLGINVLIFASAAVVTIVSNRYLRTGIEVHDEFYVLLLLATLGASILVIANHFASVFLGLELLSISLVAMVCYLRDRSQSLEAAMKYLILSATASSVLLLGMAFIYAYSGDLTFNYINTAVNMVTSEQSRILFFVGSVLILCGFAFKLSLAPFHFWTPDVYQGAPAPVTMFLATVSKLSMFAVLVKFWFIAEQFKQQQLLTVITIIAIASMLIGNLLALKQRNLKRLLAYSSIAHMGYLLIILKVSAIESLQLAWESALFYLMAYTFSTLLLFTFLGQVSNANKACDVDDLDSLRGFFWQNPMQASCLMVAILSLAGIPLTAGFIGKFYLLSTAVVNDAWVLLSALVVGSAIALYYYLTIIFVMFDKHASTASSVSESNSANTSNSTNTSNSSSDSSIDSDKDSPKPIFKLHAIPHILMVTLGITLLLFGIVPDIISEEVRIFALSKFG
ncbi:NADH-quinone oxidoreductase subunit N [Thalassotalea crassostreae]|uniref:NADH-quinone oxidoreductase subunit N n=1 Tax=Thalassotalea crassostreae TaxID=1763536 RepID=UPI000837E363|nr:NADH-quinone oxidoreductase subunit N [Thalassotalea crassostreae]